MDGDDLDREEGVQAHGGAIRTGTGDPIWSPPDAPPHPALDGNQETETCVIGGGIVGVATALRLAEAGHRVTLLEARRIGDGTTGRSTAKVSVLQGARYRTVTRLHGAEAARDLATVQRGGLGWIASQIQRHGIECDWERRSAYTIAMAPEGAAIVEEEAVAARDAGLQVETTEEPGLPFPTAAALELADQAQLSPRRFLDGLIERLDELEGATVHESSRVTAVEGRGPFRVVTEGGTVHAERVVVATLLPILDRGLFFARAQPSMSYTIAVSVEGELPAGMYLSVDEPSRSLRTARHDGEEILLVGGGGAPVGDGPRPTETIAQLEGWARRWFPVAEVLAAWSAHDLVPASHLPLVGPLTPWQPGILAVTGLEKWGIAMGAAASGMVADRILGRAGGEPWGPFDPRHLSVRGLPEAARVNLRVAARLAGDWLRPDSPADATGSGSRGRVGLVPVGHPGSATGEGDLGDGTEEPGEVRVVCTHLGGVCRWNDLDRTWDCPLHGSRFAADGSVLSGPATRPLRRRD